MSFPNDLFYPVGVVTCIMVFTAHRPHALSNRKTWFGYWKDDGHVKVKHLGRTDRDHPWPEIRDRWVENFRNRQVHAGEGVLRYVTAADEWCAEAYIETDYSALDTPPFEKSLNDYVSFQLRQEYRKEPQPLDASNWKPFLLGELFDIRKGKRLTKANMRQGKLPFIGSIEDNNGISQYVGQPAIHEGNTLTVNYNGSVAESFYQPVPYWASDDVNVLYPKFEMTPLVGLFIATLIRQERYRFIYGCKWHLDRMLVSPIRLPHKSDGTPDFLAMEALMSRMPLAGSVK